MIVRKRIKHHFQPLNLIESRFTRAIRSFVLVKSRVETFKRVYSSKSGTVRQQVFTLARCKLSTMDRFRVMVAR